MQGNRRNKGPFKRSIQNTPKVQTPNCHLLSCSSLLPAMPNNRNIRPDSEAEPKPKAGERVRGRNTSAAKRAAEFSDDFEVRSCGKMWCKHCGVTVKFEEKTYAVRHLNSQSHKRWKKDCSATNIVPGPSATLRSVNPAPSKTAPSPEKQKSPVKSPVKQKQRQADMDTMMEKMNTVGCPPQPGEPTLGCLVCFASLLPQIFAPPWCLIWSESFYLDVPQEKLCNQPPKRLADAPNMVKLLNLPMRVQNIGVRVEKTLFYPPEIDVLSTTNNDEQRRTTTNNDEQRRTAKISLCDEPVGNPGRGAPSMA